MRIAVTVLALVALAGCDQIGSTGKAHTAVKELVGDPDTAKFDKDVSEDNGLVCGLVTAKDKTTGQVAQNAYIYDAASGARLFHDVPDRQTIADIGQTPAADPSWQAKHDAFEAGCHFYLDWNSKCTGAPSLSSKSDQGVCTQWKSQGYKLDALMATFGVHQQ